MKAISVIVLALALSACSLRAPQQLNWIPIAQQLSMSSVMLEDFDGDGYCTAFTIAPATYMTAAHCVTRDQPDGGYVADLGFVDGVGMELVWLDIEHDAAIFTVALAAQRPVLCYSDVSVQVGEAVASFGFALEDDLGAHFRTGIVSGIEQGYIFYDQAGIGGMSGGPMVNRYGQVISVNQISDRTRHFAGAPIIDILNAGALAYWDETCTD